MSKFFECKHNDNIEITAMASFLFYVVPLFILIGIRKYRESKWGRCKNNVELNNKVALITGANSGIGLEIAKELVKRKAHVILACRSLKNAEETIEVIKKQLKIEPQLAPYEVDLASLHSVKKFADEINKKYPKIHYLINNAGVSYPDKLQVQTEDGVEIHFGVNHLGHFYLTNLLLEKIKSTPSSRVVIISSKLHEKGEINFKSPPKTKKYACSKLANIYFCRELAKRNVRAYAVCPGWVYTRLFRHSLKWYHYIMVLPLAFLYMRSPKMGAQTAIYCITEPDLEKESGQIYADCKKYRSNVKFDDKIGEELWLESENLIQTIMAQ